MVSTVSMANPSSPGVPIPPYIQYSPRWSMSTKTKSFSTSKLCRIPVSTVSVTSRLSYMFIMFIGIMLILGGLGTIVVGIRASNPGEPHPSLTEEEEAEYYEMARTATLCGILGGPLLSLIGLIIVYFVHTDYKKTQLALAKQSSKVDSEMNYLAQSNIDDKVDAKLQQTSIPKFCPNCGTERASGNFCLNCGKK